MKHKFILALICCIGMLFGTAYAEQYTDKISCWAGIGDDKNSFMVSGQLLGATEQKMVAIYVGNGSDVLCMEQIFTDREGNFIYVAPIDKDFKSNYYNVGVGSTGYEAYWGTFHATTGMADHTIMTADADLSVSFDGNIPTVSGTVFAAANTAVEFTVSGIDSGEVVQSNTIFAGTKENLLAENEKIDINYILPNISSSGGYRINIKSSGNVDGEDKEFMVMTFDITMELLTVYAEGEVTVLNDGYIYAQMFSPINKAKKITETGTFSGNIPKVSFPLNMRLTNFRQMPVYKAEEPEQPAPPVTIPSVSMYMAADDEKLVMFKVSDMTSTNEKRYKITYDPTTVQIAEFYGFYSVGTTGLNPAGAIEIESMEDGVVQVLIKDNSISAGMTRSGTIGVLRCKNISGTDISTKIEYEQIQ